MFIAGIILCFAVTAAAIPFYLKLVRQAHSIKTLSLKMLCSTMFVAAGVFAAAQAGAFSQFFARFMLLGFALSWVGDFLLHMEGQMVKYIIGAVAFLAAHVLFILAYIKTAQALPGERPVLSVTEIIIILALWVLVIIGSFAFKLKLKKLAVPVFIYALALMFMFVKASSLGYALMSTGAPCGTAAFACLTLGAALFTVSDATLAINFFSKKSNLKEAVNIIAYYAGQLLLATSIMFVCAA